MKRAWTHLTLLVPLVILPAAPAGGRQKPPAGRPAGAADPLRVVLEKNGYVAVPLAQEERDNCFTVVCKSGTETWRMLLDTGAEDSSLDTGLVKKLGLKHGDEVKVIGIEGVRTGVEVSLRGLSIGDLDSRAAAGSFSLQAFDFTGTNATRGQRKLRRIDGLLGRSVLRLYSAVIDYPTRTLYLRTPLDGLRPEIEGRWVATRVEADGRERQPGPKGPPRLEFKDRRFHLTDGANEYIFGLHVRPEKDRYAVSFFDPEQEFATEVTYRAGGLLKVSGDKLTVCLALDPAARGKLPDDFAAPAGSGRLLLEFRRERPADRPTTDPVRAVLEKKGYVAVPLTQEDGDNRASVACKSGTEPFRLILDTGAEASALDTGLAKKLGLKHEGEVAIGDGGARTGAEVNLRGLLIGDFDTRAISDSLFFVAYDFTELNTFLGQRKLRPIDGVLGHSTLGATSAVIDYSTRTLYLRTLLDGLWPEVEGRWVATGAQEDGRERPLDPNTPLRVEFKDRRFHLIDGPTRYTFGLHVNPVKDHYTMMFFDPEQEFARELKYRTGGRLKVSGDKLTICLCIDTGKAMGKLPDEFKAPAGSGHLLLEFRREKPRP